ncbi:MAG: FAD-dependent thymidylate synthase, partial [Candidatus Zixiibacteriota bacterium]
FASYNEFIDSGLAREIARVCLPLSIYTEWYWKIDLHNLFHFLRLRLDKHAQKEIREYAKVMAEMVRMVCPIAYEAFVDYRLEALSFSKQELLVLKDTLGTFDLSISDIADKSLSKREVTELLEKLGFIKNLD